MNRLLGIFSLIVSVVATVAANAVSTGDLTWLSTGGIEGGVIAQKTLLAVAVVAGTYGIYHLVRHLLVRRIASKRRAHDVRNVLRFGLGAVTIIGLLGVLTEQWVGVLFSLGIVGFAVTFALQQPLFSLMGWIYIMVKRPYQVGDRVRIGDAKGDVIEVDFLVTTLWEINGELVSSNQPSGRVVTLPNSTVLSSEVYNFSWEEFPYVWNEISIQLSYETDLAFARQELTDVADDYLGERMAQNIARYRELLAETPVELEVRDGPTVNVVQQESWVELRLRYLVHPRRGQRAKNDLYERILERFKKNPDRISFPVSRNR
ncbi:mechanosensitive ion channel family protein [Natrinema salsiterrestre]|uniref:Mechanosensitive ion channel family protein n=1 Tax=Natrinema salsiterrestre TaxID=2950540 RepID=A0A9Q4Q3P9_9EURY|nr:mechanosensitive ion channel family protein [Natrinema salsiterrestre]MDF9746417.1 mechanosensitive ion channel family protein [Natrinema salsiterrestre]